MTPESVWAALEAYCSRPLLRCSRVIAGTQLSAAGDRQRTGGIVVPPV